MEKHHENIMEKTRGRGQIFIQVLVHLLIIPITEK
jgi:hypothetical protein